MVIRLVIFLGSEHEVSWRPVTNYSVGNGNVSGVGGRVKKKLENDGMDIYLFIYLKDAA
jgi:hypothetical protein